MPNEERLLSVAFELMVRGEGEFHGYRMVRCLEQAGAAMNYTTVYRCLDRLENRGLLQGRWEIADGSSRPRKVYVLTGLGIQAASTIDDVSEAVVRWRMA